MLPPPLTIRFPSGLKLTLLTAAECPLSVSVSWPVWASQTFSVLSSLPLTPPALRHPWSRLRSLPTGLRYGSVPRNMIPPPAAYLMELRSTRKPRL